MARISEDAILLSIDPLFAEQIFTGEKIFEFRKPTLPDDLSYVFLVENGTRQIPGGFQVGSVHERPIDKLWDQFGEGVSERQRFFDYFEGWDRGLAIEVEKADKFDEPLPLSELVSSDKNLQVPNQFSFVYLTKGALKLLADHADITYGIFPDATLDQWTAANQNVSTGGLDFRPMRSTEEGFFREHFLESPVPTEYEEIDDSFLEHIIESHHKGEDPYGYFTKRKQVLTYLDGEEPIGFTVITFKRGRSVKFGPTVLAEEHRGTGKGSRLRRMVDGWLRTEGIRKTYSTIPEDQLHSFRYLINSGYSVEAHMQYQYHEGHSDLVFGKLLEDDTNTRYGDIVRDSADELRFTNSTGQFDDFSNFVITRMEPWYTEIDQQFVSAIVEAEKRSLDGDLSKKAKRVFLAYDDKGIQASVIASRKRGGGVKISPFLSKVQGGALIEFLEYVEKDLLDLPNIRKFYTHVPLPDNQLLSFFSSAGYTKEGLLKQPYREGVDMVFLGKLIT